MIEQCCGGKHCQLEKKRKTWSILICTLKERKKQFMILTDKLMAQIEFYKLEKKVEVLYLSDSLYDVNKMSIGTKRNQLVESANGVYVSFVDDDDAVANDYIIAIYNKLKNKPDCVGMKGIITTNGTQAKEFIHSIKYTDYYEQNNIYYRCPNHLNPIKKEIVKQVMFTDKSHGEDTDFAKKLCKMKLLKTEEFISYPIYFYRYIRKPIHK